MAKQFTVHYLHGHETDTIHIKRDALSGELRYRGDAKDKLSYKINCNGAAVFKLSAGKELEIALYEWAAIVALYKCINATEPDSIFDEMSVYLGRGI